MFYSCSQSLQALFDFMPFVIGPLLGVCVYLMELTDHFAQHNASIQMMGII